MHDSQDCEPSCNLGPVRKRSHLGGFENLPSLRLYRIARHDRLQLAQHAVA